MKHFKIITGLTLIIIFSSIANAQTNWSGEYEFGEDGGETAGGSKIYIAHTIKITEKDGKLDAHISSQGFQTSRDIYADVKLVGDKIEFYYREKGVDQYTSEYEKGDLLLTLEKKESDGKTKILTFWGAFTPALDANLKSGEVYFKTTETENKIKIENEWMQIESEDKEFSVAMPANSSVDAESKDSFSQHKVDGIINGVTLKLIVYKKGFSKKNLKKMKFDNPRLVKNFTFDDYFIRSIPGDLLNDRYSQRLYIASDKTYYFLSVSADSNDEADVYKFLLSIKIKGNSIFNNIENGQSKNDSGTIKKTSIDKLQTSPEIIEAYERKFEKTEREIIYQLGSINDVFNNDFNYKKFSRRAIVVDLPRPRFSPEARQIRGKTEIAIKVQLLASGQIGDITVLSSPTESFARECCFESVKKIRFVPSQINGTNVDSSKIVRYYFQSFGTGIF